MLRNNPTLLRTDFDLRLDSGYSGNSVVAGDNPGNSTATIQEKILMKNMNHLDEYLNFRDSVHGVMQSQQQSPALEKVSLDSLKNFGKISMQPVNGVKGVSGVSIW